MRTWNDYLQRIKYFFRWVYNVKLRQEKDEDPLDPSDWNTPTFVNPFAIAEDIKTAVSFLETRNDVDEQGIGALDLCASGSYVPFAAQTDRPNTAVATVGGADMRDLFRKGLPSSHCPNIENLGV
jgi:hypothetical protein